MHTILQGLESLHWQEYPRAGSYLVLARDNWIWKHYPNNVSHSLWTNSLALCQHSSFYPSMVLKLLTGSGTGDYFADLVGVLSVFCNSYLSCSLDCWHKEVTNVWNWDRKKGKERNKYWNENKGINEKM